MTMPRPRCREKAQSPSTGDIMPDQNQAASERIATYANQMEEALMHEHVDRFHEIARRRRRDLHALIERRRDARADPTREREALGVESILARAVQENQRMLGVARERLGDMSHKIELLLERKSTHRQIGRRYSKTAPCGRLFSYNG